MRSVLESMLEELAEREESGAPSPRGTAVLEPEPRAALPPRKSPTKRARTKKVDGTKAAPEETIRAALGVLEPDSVGGDVADEVRAAHVGALEPIARPSGQLYHPRLIAGKPDFQALRELRTAGVPVLLSGYPGGGKTSLIEAAFEGEGGVVTFAGHGEAEIGDLVGSYVQHPDGSFGWSDGPLVLAMKEGRVLFVDDATLTPTGVLARLYPAMDGRGVITLTEHQGETITAAPGFYVVGAHNPGVPGAVLSEALSSRFSVHLEVATDLRLARRLGVEPAVIAIARSMQSKRTAGEVLWAPEMRELLAFNRVKEVLGRTAALENLLSICPEAEREVFTPLLAKHLTAVKPLGVDEAPLH